MAKSFHHSFEVCTCKQVTLGEILFAIKENGANSIEKIGEKTDAGTCCGCCVSSEKDFGEEKMELYLTNILNKFEKEN
ncbi:(2Fe-2S)-binding protein [Arcobacter sp.]|uniref:(2Fe-2S)-binding protein n=1 Tax=Arcobacter sp. TaxID=1872629 RepID=UPI003D0B48D6